MVLQTISRINLRQSASKTAPVKCVVPASVDVTIIGTKIIWKDNVPFVKATYNGQQGFINGRYLRGLVLKVKGRDNAKYPKLAVIASGRASRRIKIPQQTKFGAFCQKHGCSMAWKGCPTDANKRIRNDIQKAIHDGHIVLLEQKNPIHTNVIIGRSIDGKYVVATNGTTKKVTMNWLIKTVLHGKAGRKNQANWWKGTAHGAGYVIVKRA